jgi:hypothetical protein
MMSGATNSGTYLLIDHRWKEQIEHRLEQLERARPFVHQSPYETASRQAPMLGPESTTPTVMQPGLTPVTRAQAQYSSSGSTGHTSLNFTCSPGAFPASSIQAERAVDHSSAVEIGRDVITDGLLSLQAVQAHFDFFQEHLNRYVHHLLPISDTLATVCQRSPMLVAAICTVAAFCANSPEYQECLGAFKTLVSAKTFARNHNFDEIRALCIGSFWLNDISYALCSLGKPSHLTQISGADTSAAVRLASEVNLHRCITKMPHTNPKCYERTRLYFLVVICDHHCSLRHGRPPMTSTLTSLKSPRTLLESEHSTSNDVPLIAELELWAFNSQVFGSFGADVGSPLSMDRYSQLQDMRSLLDHWRSEWTQMFQLRNEYINIQPIMELQHSAAVLCLLSHVFRGTEEAPVTSAAARTTAHGPPWRRDLESEAIQSASTYITSLFGLPERVGFLPSYFATMTAFSTVFILRAILPGWTANDSVPAGLEGNDPAAKALQDLSKQLPELVRNMHTSHPLSAVARSLPVALAGYKMGPTGETESQPIQAPNFPSSWEDLNMPMFETDLFGQPFDGDTGWMAFPFAESLHLDCSI